MSFIFRKAIFYYSKIFRKAIFYQPLQSRNIPSTAFISTETATFLLLMVYLFPAVGNFASVSLTFGTEKWKKTNRLRANYLHDAVIFHSIHKGSYLHFTVLIDLI